jgi:uncharacterized cupin superfamily protein
MKITIEKSNEQYLQDRKVRSWNIWEKKISRFDLHFDETEEYYPLGGKVVGETQEGKIEFGAGDFVTYPTGLSCVWDIKEPVKKRYNIPR